MVLFVPFVQLQAENVKAVHVSLYRQNLASKLQKLHAFMKHLSVILKGSDSHHLIMPMINDAQNPCNANSVHFHETLFAFANSNFINNNS